MTPSDIINSVLKIKPSVLDTSALLSFLNRVEAKLQLILNDQAEFVPFKFENIATDTLLLGQEHSEIYEYYLCSQIDFYSNDIASYNNSTVMYNTAMIDYANEIKSRKAATTSLKFNYEGAFKK